MIAAIFSGVVSGYEDGKRNRKIIGAMGDDEFSRYMRIREICALEKSAEALRRESTRSGLFVGRTW